MVSVKRVVSRGCRGVCLPAAPYPCCLPDRPVLLLMRRAQSKDPTNIGSLADSVAFNAKEEAERKKAEAQMPKARGLVKDTVDPRLKKSVAK